MVMNLKRIIIEIPFLVSFMWLNAQKTTTTFTAANYIGEVSEFLEKDKGSSKEQLLANEKLLKLYTPIWTDYSKVNKERIVAISNQLVKLKVRQQPDFYRFIEVQLTFINSTQTAQSFDNWVESLDLILKKKRKLKDFNEFVAYTEMLLKDNILSNSRSAKWEFQEGTTYSFEIINDRIAISFNNPFELFYNSDKDGGTIAGTKGVYYPMDNEWIGSGGKIDWARTGLSSAQVWATLATYTANTKFPKFTADSVQFVNKKYLKEPVLGRLEEQLMNQMPPEKYNFPKFRSYKKDFVIPGILPNVDYRGSFMMNGSKFITSDSKNPATLIFYRDQQPFIIASAYKFLLTPEKAVSEAADVTIYLDGDSIFNSGVALSYVSGDKKLSLINGSKRNYYSPYTNTYHNLDMYCENITWDIPGDKLDISMLRQQGTQSYSSFESSDYYSLQKYLDIQGIDQISPLQKVYRYMKNRQSNEFYIDEFAQFIKMDLIQAKLMIHNLAKAGLLTFNEGEGRVYVKEKLPIYSRAYAKSPKVDYDALILNSETANTENAVLDLKTNDLAMRGVKKFVVSDTHQVAIYPKGGNLVVKKNRNIIFDGLINAGRFVMFVSEANFSYDTFKLTLPQIDSMMFYVKSFTDTRPEAPLVLVRTPIHNLKGEILVDKPNNKSGLKKIKDYPIFNSLEDSYAYYDNPKIRGGVYKRDKFYYTLKPFTIKNMMTFETDSLEFAGTLTSAGIFPEIKEPLKVQKDYSLGFIVKTPSAGLPAYGGKGQYKNTIDLSNKGLLGEGDLEYLSSVTRASKNNMVFMPDSMLALTDTFYIAETASTPDAKAGRVDVKWLPYQDEMYATSRKTSFSLYRGETQFRGQLVLRPAGLQGGGNAVVREAELYAELFDMKPRNMTSNISEFKLRSDLYDNIALSATDVKSNIDYDKQIGTFISNKAMECVSLDIIQYVACIDKFVWDMNKKEVSLQNSKSTSTQGLGALALNKRVGKIMPGARYVSVNPKQDSLSFFAVQGLYKYNAGQLTAKDVFMIEVADAAIAPKGDSVRIYPKAEMEKLSGAQILADVTDKYHLFYDAEVEIDGSNSYYASGYIDYIDEANTKQKIFLSEISPDAEGMTVGNGFISDSIGFMLSPAFAYMGKVTVDAQDPFYMFDGGVQLRHKCKSGDGKLGFMKFKDRVDPKAIVIPVAEIPTDLNGKRMTASILFSKTNLEPYSSFLTLDKAADNDLLTAAGYLAYNKVRKEYRIGSEAKVENPIEETGQYLALKTESCDVVGQGELNFHLKQNFVKLFTYGDVAISSGNVEPEINMLMGFTFPFLEQALGMMGQYIADDLSLSQEDPNNENMRRALCQYMGNEEGNSLYDEFTGMGEFDKQPKIFDHTLMFDKMKWQYSPAMGYYCNTKTVLAKVGKVQVRRIITTRAQMQKRATGTELRIYLQVDADHWYYFNYNFDRQAMKVYSSIGEFNDLIRNVSEKDRIVEGKSSEGVYRYSLATKTEAQNFSRHIMNIGNPDAAGDVEEELDEDDEEYDETE